MTQISGFWTTDASTPTGHQVASYTQTHWSTAITIMAACSGHEGIAHEQLNEFDATVPSANTVRVQSGQAIVDGRWYESNDNEDVTIPDAVGAGNTRIDRVVLRTDWASFETTIHRIAGTDAVTPSAPALTQTSGTMWDMPLYQALVNTSGTVTLTDERYWATWDKPEVVYWRVYERDIDLEVGDGADYFRIPALLDGKIIKSVHAAIYTASTSGNPTFQLHNQTVGVDVLSTRVTIDETEYTSYTAAVQPVVNTSNDGVSTGDLMRIDIDVAGTGAQGLDIIISFEDD